MLDVRRRRRLAGLRPPGTRLEGLLFVSHNAGGERLRRQRTDDGRPGHAAPRGRGRRRHPRRRRHHHPRRPRAGQPVAPGRRAQPGRRPGRAGHQPAGRRHRRPAAVARSPSRSTRTCSWARDRSRARSSTRPTTVWPPPAAPRRRSRRSSTTPPRAPLCCSSQGLRAATQYRLTDRRHAPQRRRASTWPTPYEVEFTAVTDFSAVRRHPLHQQPARTAPRATVSYDVAVTNTSDYDLLLPLVLVLDPARRLRRACPADATPARRPTAAGSINLDPEPAGRRAAAARRDDHGPHRARDRRPIPGASITTPASPRCRRRTSSRCSTSPPVTSVTAGNTYPYTASPTIRTAWPWPTCCTAARPA